MRGEVLGGWHGHETHPEMSAEGSQVLHLAHGGRGVCLSGTAVGKVKALQQGLSHGGAQNLLVVFPPSILPALQLK